MNGVNGNKMNTEDIKQLFQNEIGTLFQLDLVKNILTSVVIILLIWFIRRMTLKIAFRKVEDVRTRYRWKKISSYVSFVLALLLIGRVWFAIFQSIATILGLLSAGIAIALKDLILAFAGWVFIVAKRPFEVGDRIQVGADRGDVIDVRLFKFTLMEIGNWVDADQSTGRIVHVPNDRVFRDVLANYSKGFQYLWNEVPVLLTFESDWKKAKEILLDIANKKAQHMTPAAAEKVKQASRRFMIFYAKLTPAVYTSVRDSGVLLTIRYLSPPRKRRDMEEQIWEAILEEFAKYESIQFAYPTTRFYKYGEEYRIDRPPVDGVKKP
jgi:small-conductance mechanosensitive channel